MMSIIKDFQYACLALSLFTAGASAFSSTNAGLVSSTPTTKSSIPLYMSSAAAMLPEGLVKTVVDGGSPGALPIQRGDVVTVKYTCYSTTGDDSDNILLARSDSQKMVVGDGAMVPGWDAALRTMKQGERAVIRLTDSSLGYGNDPRAAPALEALGADPSNSQLEFDILVKTVQPAAQAAQVFDMNFDAMALEDTTPKTAQEIAEAYQVKMANKAPELEGLEGWVETVKNWYFFGFFEGETGEEAPWYLKPSITFPIAFAIVGAAFYVSLLTGAISEKGAQSIDELDVIITSIASSVPGL
mmetsp:Transcript_5177/g.10716  ORF Transcript_5177/g.10716 Transcript_5177/m.10716 type:complete len:300 (-) Transcript_5177:257-1156(-)